jgi:hypothetical protein
MKSEIGSRKTTVDPSGSWQEEFGLRLRFPKPPVAGIKTVLNDSREPRIFLNAPGRTIEIVVQFKTNSQIFKPEILETFASRGLTLSKAFEDILWKKLEAGGSSIWAELVRINTEAYSQAWIHFFELCYEDHFHPIANEWLKKIKEGLASPGNKAKRGRRTKSKAENDSLTRRYDALLPNCRLIHEAAEHAVSSLDGTAKNEGVREIRKAIWDAVWKDIHAIPGDGDIFSGAAFARIPYREAKLHDPRTWKPHQLAIALLTFERGEAYQTIEKKIKPTRKTNRVKQAQS